MAIDWSLFDPMAGARLGAALDPALIQERQNKLADLAADRDLRRLQLQQAVEGIAEKRTEQAARREAMKGLTPEELQQIQLGVPYKDILERKERERLAESLFPTQAPEVPTTFSPTATEATLTPEQFMGGDQVNLADSSRMMGGAPVTPIAQPMPTQIAPVQPTENIPSKEQVARMVLMGVPGAKELQAMYYPPEKAQQSSNLARLLAERKVIADANPNDPSLRAYDNAIRKESETPRQIVNVGGAEPSWQTMETTEGLIQVNPKTGEIRKLSGASGEALRKPSSASKLTEFQGKSMAFGTRAQDADKVFDTIGTNYSPMAVNAASSVESVPGVGMSAYALLGDKERQVMQAQRNFINAVLRQESGAVISPSEFDNARRQYFPQPGDDPGTLAQKKANRRRVIETFKEETGPAGRSYFEGAGQEQPANAPKFLGFE